MKYRLQQEVGTIYKPHTERLTFALAFPNTYEVGMSSLGFQTIYRILNSRSDSVCERVFMPDRSDLEQLSRTRRLTTMESQTPVQNFDVLAFSLSFEMDCPNVMRLMDLSGIEPMAAGRISGSRQPLVIAGGPAVTFNPEPLADFVDAFVIGEAEDVLDEVADVLRGGIDGDRETLLKRLAQIEGVYVPMFYTPLYREDGTIARIEADEGVPSQVRRRWAAGIGKRPASTVILTPETEFSNMTLVEVARGCGRQCRFCAAGFTYLPSRPADPDAVMDAIHAHASGVHRVGLMSASVFDHPGSSVICQSLISEGVDFSISSTRADTLSRDVAGMLTQGGHKTLTIAPEAGTERLRTVINKTISYGDIRNAAESAWDSGFKRVKLYFMIGLPTETEDDIRAIADLAIEIAGMHKWRKVSASVSCFVPKPSTPFQWAPMDAEGILADKLKLIRALVRPVNSIEFHSESPREAIVQGVLSRGDRRVGKALLLYSRKQISWKAAFRESGSDPVFYAERLRPPDEVFPWDHIDLGVRKSYLLQEYQRALEGIATPKCGPGPCRRCGVCE